METTQASSQSTTRARQRLCDLHYWRIERIHGEQPGWLYCLMCTDGHIHHVGSARTKEAMYSEMRRWVNETYGPEHPGLLLEYGGVAWMPAR